MNSFYRRSLGIMAVVFFAFGGPALWSQTALPFVHPLFTNNMVLQRDATDPVWGWTAPGATVAVVVKDQNNATLQTSTATAGTDGRWQANVGPFAAVPNNAAYSLVITGPDSAAQTVTVSNVLIGDVWLCSGQSNMEYTLYGNYPPGSGGTRMANSDNEIAAAATNPFIRHFKASRGTTATTPRQTFIGGVDNNGWTTSANASAFTAVGYFMAKQIYTSQNVPVGLLNLTWGGTDITPWVSPDSIRKIADYTTAIDNGTLTQSYYNTMIAPAVPFRIKGAVWYQGETSTAVGGPRYGALLAALRDGLRSKFGQSALPFIVVQLSTNGSAQTQSVEPTNGSSYAEIREAQLNTALADANSRVVVTLDCTYIDPATAVSGGVYNANVHPINKQTMGLRAGQAALNLAYGQATPYLSPTFNHATVSGSAIRCTFDNVGAGLMVGLMPPGLAQNAAPAPSPVQKVDGGTLTGFAIAGADKVYYNATTTLDPATNTVVVASASVPSPLYVRYGWGGNPWNTATNSPLCNLYRVILDGSGNVIDGVPVSPFRNDPVVRLSVNSGSGSGAAYSLGQQVAVAASAAASGQAFAFWGGDTDLLANPASASTTATLSRTYVSVRAVYRLNTAPAGLAATAGSLSATLSWNAVANATSYSVKRSATAGGPFVTLATGLLSTGYTDNATGFGNAWYYVVTATNTAGESPASSAVAVTPLEPAAPAGVAVTAGNGVLTLGWNAVTNATGYRIARSSVDGGPYAPFPILSGNSYVDTGLTNGAVYYYVVSAVYGNAAGPASAQISATPSTGTALLVRSTGGSSAASVVSTNQTDVQAFDQSTSTKWYATATAPGWLQYQFGKGAAWAITQYKITSANDVAQRDPRDWQLLGSNDGYLWSVVDTRRGETFGSRLLTKTYTFTNTTPWRYYRLNITANNGGSSYGIQLSEFELASAPTDAGDKTAPVLSVPGTLTALATGASGAVLFFTATASDAVSGPVTPVCTPASGFLFPIGATLVQCSATDAAGNTATAFFTVNIQASFVAYLQGYFDSAQLGDSSKTGPTADFDGDGIANLQEYFMGTNPTVADAAGATALVNDGKGNLVFSFRMAKNTAGVSGSIQKSTDLVSWTDTGATAQQVSDQGAYVVMQATIPTGGAARLFLRLRVITL